MAMITLAEYLASPFVQTQSTTKALEQLLQEIANLFLLARDSTRPDWPYSCNARNVSELHFPPDADGKRKISLSTQAMCCVAVSTLLEAREKRRVPSDSKVLGSLEGHLDQTVAAIIDQLKQPTWTSIYGTDDVFTASWLLALLDKHPKSKWPSKFKKRVVLLIGNALTDPKTKQPNLDRSLFFSGQDEAGAHPLPLLKVARALQVIETRDDLKTHWETAKFPDLTLLRSVAGKWFEGNLHRQMSFFQFEDFRFDAAELIFCLTGALDTGVIQMNETIISKVLDVVVRAQERSVYWRPYRPMLSDPQGKVLLPLSIEVASALLHTLRQTLLFHEYSQTLQKYFEWLVSQKVDYPSSNGKKASGWHSENAYETPRIHLWGTSLIAMFFSNLLDALDNESQEELKKTSRFSVITPEIKTLDLESMVPFDLGLAGGGETVNTSLKRDYILPVTKRDQRRAFSLLLYGPPGTAKTTIAKAIAKQLGFDLIYLSPSNFISQGEAGIEVQARLVFQALMGLKKCVILFDEIDRMILDRDSKPYGQQGEMFQFMTPGMLVRLNDLRKSERSVFIISTNYAERIDKAIKREGRIDRSLLCLPFDLTARAKVLGDLIMGHFERIREEESNQQALKFSSKTSGEIHRIAKACALYVYEELDRFVRDALPTPAPSKFIEFCEEVIKKLADAAIKLPPPQISLSSYLGRLDDTNYRQRPYEEYLNLLLLELESSPSNRDRENEFIKRLQEWKSHDQNEYENRSVALKSKAKAYGLESLFSVD